jgi:hypothetical protein
MASEFTWQDGRARYGKIKKGQLWRKRDTGWTMRVAKKKNDKFMCANLAAKGTGHGSHTLTQKDIYKYYDLITL